MALLCLQCPLLLVSVVLNGVFFPRVTAQANWAFMNSNISGTI